MKWGDDNQRFISHMKTESYRQNGNRKLKKFQKRKTRYFMCLLFTLSD